jgi:hypothetical protein
MKSINSVSNQELVLSVRGQPPHYFLVSIPTENSSFCWLKIPPPTWWLRFTVAADSMKMESVGEAEAGSAGVQPAKE